MSKNNKISPEPLPGEGDPNVQMLPNDIPVAVPPPPTYDEFFMASRAEPSAPFLSEMPESDGEMDCAPGGSHERKVDSGRERIKSGGRRRAELGSEVDVDYRLQKRVLEERRTRENEFPGDESLSPRDHLPSSFEDEGSDKYQSLFRLIETTGAEAVREELLRIQSRETPGFLLRPAYRKPENKATALHHAIKLGKISTAKELLLFGGPNLAQAEMEVKVAGVRTQITALQMSVDRGMWEVTKSLVVDVFQSEPLRKKQFTQTTTIMHDGQRFHDVNVFHIAALRGCMGTVALLIKYKAEVDCLSRTKDTPLMMAVKTGSLQLVELLVSHKAHISHKNADNATPLYWAIRYGHKPIVTFLVDKGADVKISTNSGFQYPIICAAALGHLDIMDLLVTKNADVKVKTKHGETALHYAAASGTLEVVNRLLSSGLTYNTADSKGNIPLFQAALHGNRETLLKLLQLDSKIDHKNKAGETVWNFAIRCPNLTSLKELIHHVLRVKPEGYTVQGSAIKFPAMISPLHLASETGDIEKLSYLLRSGIDENCRDASGNSFLHTAAKHDQPEILEVFGNSASANEGNKQQDTCLHVACRHGSYQCLEVLIPLSVLDKTNNEGQTGLHVAAGAIGMPDFLPMLQEEMKQNNAWGALEAADKQGNTALHIAAERGTAETIYSLRSLNFRAKNKEGNTPLHVALLNGNNTTFLAMLNIFKQATSVFDVNIENNSKETVLVIACRLSNLSAIRDLIAAGANLAMRKSAKDAVMHAVVRMSVEDPYFENAETVLKVLYEESALWLSKFLKIPYPSANPQLANGYKQIATIILTRNLMNGDGQSTVHLAANIGGGIALQTLAQMPGTFLRGGNCCDVSDLIPQSVTNHAMDVTDLAKKHKLSDGKISALKNLSNGYTGNKPSVLELVLNHHHDDVKAAEMLDIPPIKLAVNYMFGGYQILSFLGLVAHIWFMVYFSETTTTWLQQNTTAIALTNGTLVTISGSYFIWPIFNILYLGLFVVLMFLYIFKPPHPNPQQVIKRKECSGLYSTLHWGWNVLITNLAIGEVTGVVFVVCSMYFIVAFQDKTSASDVYDYHVVILAAALTTGWLYTFCHLRAFRTTYKLMLILKKIVFYDLTKFLIIYAVIWIAFSYAIRVFISGSATLSSSYPTVLSLQYTLFTWVFGIDELFGKEADISWDSYRYVMILYVAFLVITTLLFVYMIAIVNHSYREMQSFSDMTWRINTLRNAIRFEQAKKCCGLCIGVVLCCKGFIASSRKLEQRNNRFFMTIPPDDSTETKQSDKQLEEIKRELSGLKTVIKQLGRKLDH